MRNIYCLSKQTIEVLKQPNIKLEVMLILGLSDARTIDKHIQNNFHDGPLMNYNIIKFIKQCTPHLSTRNMFHKLTADEVNTMIQHKNQLKQRNATYNQKSRNKDETSQTAS